MTEPAAEPAAEPDEYWMRQALELAARAAEQGEIPIGAILLGPDGEILGEGANLRVAHSDPTAHAEVVALRQAGLRLGVWNLEGSTMYVTVEPCTMCAGALVNARVRRVVFGCAEPKFGAIGSLWDVATDPRLNHRLQVRPGVLADEAADLMRSFFAARRRRPGPAERDAGV